MELIPPLGVGKVIDSTPASVHKDPNSECLRPIIPGLEKLRNGVSKQENAYTFGENMTVMVVASVRDQ